MQVLGSVVSPGRLLLGLGLEVGVGDAEAVVAAELEEALSILICLPNAIVTQAGCPGAVVSSNSGFEITENKQRLLWRHIADDSGELILEPVLCF